MTKARANAYRKLLYRAMIDIRNLCQSRGPASKNPIEWHRQYHRSRAAGAIADWLHNLANYAAQDFRGFDEDAFWHDHESVARRFPGFGIENYRDSFENYQEDIRRPW